MKLLDYYRDVFKSKWNFYIFPLKILNQFTKTLTIYEIVITIHSHIQNRSL